MTHLGPAKALAGGARRRRQPGVAHALFLRGRSARPPVWPPVRLAGWLAGETTSAWLAASEPPSAPPPTCPTVPDGSLRRRRHYAPLLWGATGVPSSKHVRRLSPFNASPTARPALAAPHTRGPPPPPPPHRQTRAGGRSRRGTVRTRLGRLSGLGALHSKSILYGAFEWARRALNSPKRRFPAPRTEIPLWADGRGGKHEVGCQGSSFLITAESPVMTSDLLAFPIN
jgi:hypothetical protein